MGIVPPRPREVCISCAWCGRTYTSALAASCPGCGAPVLTDAELRAGAEKAFEAIELPPNVRYRG